MKLRFWVCRDNPFARNEVRSSKSEVKLWFGVCRDNPFARNEVRSSKSEVKLWFGVCRDNTEVKLRFWSTLLCTTSFFSWGSVRFLKNTIFQKSSRQWVRVPGHDMGPGIKYHTKKGPYFFPERFLTYSDRKSVSACCDWGGVDLSVCVCKASGNQSWMTLITGKFVEFPRLVARNLKVDGSNGNLLEHI